MIKNSVNLCESVSKEPLCDLCVLGGLYYIFSLLLKVENTGCPITMLFYKTNPIFARFSSKSRILFKNKAKNKPKQTQTWAICNDYKDKMKTSPIQILLK